MKTTFIISGIIIVIFLLSQAFMYKTEQNIEMYPYQVIKKFDDFEIRLYKEAKFSYVKMNGSTYKQTANNGFRMLAGYIFGDNETGEKIAMTSPVSMEMNDSVTMKFMVPANYKMENLPSPNNEKIKFKTEPEKLVAAISFGGWANDEKINKYAQKLYNLLDQNNIKHSNKFSYFGYNPPFKIVNRRNEVIVEIDKNTYYGI